MKSRGVVLASVVLVGTLAMVFGSGNDSRQSETPKQMGAAAWAPARQPSEQLQQHEVAPPAPSSPPATVPQLSLPKAPQVLAGMYVQPESTQPSVLQAIDNVDQYFALSKQGDGEASVKLFMLAMTCFDGVSPKAGGAQRGLLRREGCENVPFELGANRLGILANAAEKGDPIAAVHWALNAKNLALVDDPSVATDPVRQRQFANQSLEYLQFAAANGVREAYYALARSYEVGEFSTPDRALSFAYLYALDRMDSYSDVSTLLKQRWELLGDDERRIAIHTAERIINSCCRRR